MKCEKAVILAAGRGSRARTIANDNPKCLIGIHGKPIIRWIVESLTLSGITEITLVTGFKAHLIEEAMGDGSSAGISIKYVHNTRWEEPNGVSLYAVKDFFKEGDYFLTLMSDHLLPPTIIKKIATSPNPKCLLAVDTDLDGIYDISDATKVRLRDGVPVAISKKLRTYHAVDCGLFRFDHRVFQALEKAFSLGKKALTDGVRVLIENGDLAVIPIGKETFWIDIDTPRAYRYAERSMQRFLSLFEEAKGRENE